MEEESEGDKSQVDNDITDLAVVVDEFQV